MADAVDEMVEADAASATDPDSPTVDVTDVTRVGTRIDLPGSVYALNANKIELISNPESAVGCISTPTFANGEWPLFGFDTELLTTATLEEFDLTVGASEGTGSTAAIVGAAATGSLALNSISLGYVDVYTLREDTPTHLVSTSDYDAGQLFFHYSSTILSEPSIQVRNDDITVNADGTKSSFSIRNPITFGTLEASSLIDKFGVNPTLTIDDHGDIAPDAIGRSVDDIAHLIVTAYAEQVSTFPRNPPMIVKKKDISNIVGIEESDPGPAVPTATTTITDGSTY